MQTINCKGRLLSLEKPVVMGILNATPDSFYKGHSSLGMEGMLQMAAEMIHDGAAIIDIGGQSTRPSSEWLTSETELERIIPLIEKVHKAFPDTIISVDTFYSEVAEKAVKAGTSIVNDVSGGSLDPKMIATVAKLGVPYVCMHMRGTPQTMQQNTDYEDVAKEVLEYFINKTYECKTAGITDIIIDPGFGFAKTIEQNFELLKHLSIFKMLDRPILAGISRKSMIYKTLNISPEEALNGTTILNTYALTRGASILRVHDVKEAMQAIELCEKLK